MNIIGTQFIDGRRTAVTKEFFHSVEADSGTSLPYTFYTAGQDDIRSAVTAASTAFSTYRQTTCHQRAEFLEVIADELETLDDAFVGLVMRETGLPEARVRGERLRTCNQMRLFARVLRRGDYLGARIDTALPDRQPLPRPDLRQYRVALGPVAVFGASNFPLAFSVAGGDTASALAAGCPVLVKAHPSHPATSEVVAEAICQAVRRCGIPAGVFGMLFGDMVGAELVKAPGIKAVAFTGSLQAGRALCQLAAKRPEPIPIFAEMSSVNPLILLPKALAERGHQIAHGLAASVTLGSGQFCTKPGLVTGPAGADFEHFCSVLAAAMAEKEAAVMLNQGILKGYWDGIKRLEALSGMQMLTGGEPVAGRARPALFRADETLLHDRNHPLEQEVFGPVTVLVALRELETLPTLISEMQGHLTATLFAEPAELSSYGGLIEALESRVGRIILNEYPTGVEVGDAIMHGGPYPSSSDSRSTSVGSLAIDRFVRPVCYQGYPDELLPPALQNSNPLGIMRLVNGEWTTGVIKV